MPRLGLATTVIACLMLPGALAAATIEVTGDTPRKSITVTIVDAKVDAVLDDLRGRYGFELSGLENTTRGEAISMTISGSLQSVLERLLRNRNHMIVRSADNVSGIAKVMILNADYGSAPHQPARQSASGPGDESAGESDHGA